MSRVLAAGALRIERLGLLRALLLLFGTGLLVRLFLAATHAGSAPDLAAFRFVHQRLAADHFDMYSAVNQTNGNVSHFAYPYLPGYLPVLEVLFRVADNIGISFDRLVRLPQIGADLAIAWLVQWHLGWRGASAGTRLAAASLIVLAPVDILLTSAHGQIDPVEWLPVVMALVAWDRLEGDRRAIVAGLLIGLGVAIKPPAALGAIALLALGTGIRERALFAAAVAAIPAIAVAPFLLSDPHGVATLRHYESIAGQGGLSMLLQPDLALARFAGTGTVVWSDAQQTLQDAATPVSLLLLAGVAWWIVRRRPAPEVAIAACIMTVFVTSANFIPMYAIWLVPFAALAGWWRFLLAVAALHVFILPFKYLPLHVAQDIGLAVPGGAYREWAVWGLYITAGAALWALIAGRLVLTLRQRDDAPPAPGPVAATQQDTPAAVA